MRRVLILCFLHLFINIFSAMAVRSTGPLLSRLRDLMKLKYSGEQIQGYIVLSEDAHQVSFFFQNLIQSIMFNCSKIIFRTNIFLRVMDAELSSPVSQVQLELHSSLKMKLCSGPMVVTSFKLNNSWMKIGL